MPLRRLSVTLLLTLAVLGMLGPCGPAWAQSPIVPGPMSDGGNAGGALPGWVLAAAPELPRVPWPALAIVAAALALGSWRPRRAAALALVLLLAVFAFEDGLHSVH